MRRLFPGKLGPIGVALTAYDIWRRIPPRHRRRILRQATKHGPRIAKAAVAKAAASRERRRRRRP
jgi:hypothetical protein